MKRRGRVYPSAAAVRFHRRRAWTGEHWKSMAWGLLTVGVLAAGVGAGSLYAGRGYVALLVLLAGVVLIAVAAWASLQAEAATAPAPRALASRPAHGQPPGQTAALTDLDAGPTVDIGRVADEWARNADFRKAITAAEHRYLIRRGEGR